MKERQRWQPEEDALLRAYVKQYGPKEWGLVSERMGRPLHRDPKSCLERWKNYLRPGLKKGSLSPDEQALLISLQSRYGNKWKAIASHLPGRTPKRLGKWWEVFKEKQLKSTRNNNHHGHGHGHGDPTTTAASVAAATTLHHPGNYDHILQTFAEKHVLPPPSHPPPLPILPALVTIPTIQDPNTLSLSSSAPSSLLPWMMSSAVSSSSPLSSSPSSTTTASPSVSLSLSTSEPQSPDMAGLGRVFLPVQHLPTLVQLCREVDEGRQSWVQHRKEAAWRLSRLEQQLESEKARKKREMIEDFESKLQRLKAEEAYYLDTIDAQWREQLVAARGDAEAKEGKMVETWAANHAKLAAQLEQMGGGFRHSFSVAKYLR